jgi:hypothetical protein
MLGCADAAQPQYIVGLKQLAESKVGTQGGMLLKVLILGCYTG